MANVLKHLVNLLFGAFGVFDQLLERQRKAVGLLSKVVENLSLFSGYWLHVFH